MAENNRGHVPAVLVSIKYIEQVSDYVENVYPDKVVWPKGSATALECNTVFEQVLHKLSWHTIQQLGNTYLACMCSAQSSQG